MLTSNGLNDTFSSTANAIRRKWERRKSKRSWRIWQSRGRYLPRRSSTQNQALNALVFLYREVIHLELGEFSAARAKRPNRLPVVLTKAETAKLLAAMKPGTIGL